MLLSLPVREPATTPVNSLMVYLTEECNLRCSYCFVEKKPRHMTPETARKVLHYLLRSDVSGTAPEIKLSFFGGEPFLQFTLMEEIWDEWQGIRGQHPGRELLWAATTNGTLGGPRIERFIEKTQMALLISLDGQKESHEHRPFVSGRSSYDQVVKTLPRLLKASPAVTIRLTFHPQSLDLVGNVQRVLALKAPCVYLGPVVEADWRGSEEALERAFQDLAQWFIEELRQGRVPPVLTLWESLRFWHQLRPEGRRPSRPCGVGEKLLGIDPDGNVMPCHRFLYRPQRWLGTIDEPLDPDKRAPYLELTSGDIQADCDSCHARSICGGGCRVVSLQSGGGLYGHHPFHCLITQAHARAVERIYQYLSQTKESEELCHVSISSNGPLGQQLPTCPT